MKERGIIMSGDNPNLILSDRKTQTRRMMNPQPNGALDLEPREVAEFYPVGTDRKTGLMSYLARDKKHHPVNCFPIGNHSTKSDINCPSGVAGDRLYVREKFQLHTVATSEIRVSYSSGEDRFVDPDDYDEIPDDNHWRPSIHMPKWASRITLEILKVR